MQIHSIQNKSYTVFSPQLALSDLADRVNLGLIPSSETGWPVACRVLRKDTGGILHIHHNVTTPVQHMKHRESCSSLPEKEKIEHPSSKAINNREVWNAWARDTANRIGRLLREVTGVEWRTCIDHIQHVKSYAPHIDHIVLDLNCRPLQ